MSRGKPANSETEEVKLQLTSMIDVTFLLLIFFMCAMKFKTLEKKVEAFLPKDKGLAKTHVKIEEVPKITVELKRKRGETKTRVKLLDSEIGVDEAGFAILNERIQSIARSNPEMPGEINAWAEVPHADVIKAVDAFMGAHVENLTFVGAPPPGAAQSGPGDPDAR